MIGFSKKLVLVVLAGSVGFTACASRKPKPQSPPAAAPTPAETAKLDAPFMVKAFSWLGFMGKIFPKKNKPPQAQAPQLIGVIKMVNTEDKFVLIDAVSYEGTEPGALLLCITNQKQTANLRMSGLKNPPFLIADIASGTPQPGDRVFRP